MSYIIVNGPGSFLSEGLNSQITLYAFRRRFTLSEKTAIEVAAETDPLVRAVLKDFDSATYIDLSRQEVRDGVGVFVQKELLTEPRGREILSPELVDEILNKEVSTSEVPWFFSS